MPAEIQANVPTHAGGVVYKLQDGPLYLLVSPKNATEEWVLPKGHVEEGEDPKEAASREVLEEAGIVAALKCPLSIVQFQAKGKDVQVQFFLMERIGNRTPKEGRRIGWFPFEEARRRLTHSENKSVLEEGERNRIALLQA
jgi:ADP-ribose pyrophosphatase YjhB (NUDIX family)